jgi:hypothetical protein
MMNKQQYTPAQIKTLVSTLKICIDSREQVNYWITDYFDAKGIGYVADVAMPFGDYSIIL